MLVTKIGEVYSVFVNSMEDKVYFKTNSFGAGLILVDSRDGSSLLLEEPGDFNVIGLSQEAAADKFKELLEDSYPQICKGILRSLREKVVA